jgi:prepilin-type N-terminal cleavage/methylation domain-containing protein
VRGKGGPESPRYPAGRGFSLFELMVALTLICILAAVLLGRLSLYQELVEKAAMDATVRGIKTGLQIHLAELIIVNRQGEASTLETANPFQWMDVKPPNYGGRYPERPVPGKWYFDEPERQLVYVVSTGNRLELDTRAKTGQIRFRARLLRSRGLGGPGPEESVIGVTLLPVWRYNWQ